MVISAIPLSTEPPGREHRSLRNRPVTDSGVMLFQDTGDTPSRGTGLRLFIGMWLNSPAFHRLAAYAAFCCVWVKSARRRCGTVVSV